MNIQENPKVIKVQVNKYENNENELNSPKRKLEEKPIKKEKKCKKKKKSKSKRCYFCNKKVGLIEYKCRCSEEHLFCVKHKLPNQHDCKFDFKEHYKNQIELRNPKIEFEKLNSI